MKQSTLGITVITLFVLSCPIDLKANTYTLTTEGEQVTFVEAPQLGYITKLTDAQSSFMTIVGSPLKDVAYARRLQEGRLNIWAVENTASGAENSRTINILKTNSGVAYAAPVFTVNGETVGIIPEIVVRVKPDIEMESIQELCETMNLAIIKPMEFTTQEYLLEVLGADTEAVFEAVEQLDGVDWIEWAAPNVAFEPRLCGEVIPNDEYFPLQWHLHNTGQSGGTPGVDINASEAWEITTGDPNIIVALLDNGFDLNHPDLFKNLISGYDFVDGDDEPEPPRNEPVDGHGTACAGLIAAVGNNTTGVTGVVWDCKIMPVRIEGPGEQLITEAKIATAFRWAANHGADVISNSWATRDNPLPVVRSGIIDVTEQGGIGRNGKGCVVLGASGNNGRFVSYPARYPEVISVGAADHRDLRWPYSGYGPELDLVAPSGGTTWANWLVTMGKDWMWSTDIIGAPGFSELNSEDGWEWGMLDYNAMGGTSGACPVAAGVAALILSVEPDLTNVEVRHFLERSAKDLGDPGRDEYYGWGRVDARAALDMVLAKRADLDNDWRVDLDDLVILIESWGTNDPLADIAPATKRDGVVEDQDLELMMRYWDVEIPEMDAPRNRQRL